MKLELLAVRGVVTAWEQPSEMEWHAGNGNTILQEK